jgi:hypothetical protein
VRQHRHPKGLTALCTNVSTRRTNSLQQRWREVVIQTGFSISCRLPRSAARFLTPSPAVLRGSRHRGHRAFGRSCRSPGLSQAAESTRSHSGFAIGELVLRLQAIVRLLDRSLIRRWRIIVIGRTTRPDPIPSARATPHPGSASDAYDHICRVVNSVLKEFRQSTLTDWATIHLSR